MKKNTFKVLFYLRGNHVNKDGTSAIMIRISIDGEIEQLTSKLYVDSKVWDTKRGRANGRSAKILELNGRLQDTEVLLKEHDYDIQRRHGYVTAEMVRNAYYFGKTSPSSAPSTPNTEKTQFFSVHSPITVDPA